MSDLNVLLSLQHIKMSKRASSGSAAAVPLLGRLSGCVHIEYVNLRLTALVPYKAAYLALQTAG